MAKSAHEPTTVCPTCKAPIVYAQGGVLQHPAGSTCPIKRYVIAR